MKGSHTTAAETPRYQQVKDHILARIRSGDWRANARVPSEHELMRALGVARMTANRALRELAQMGVLRRVAGLGTFVADLKSVGHPLSIRNIAEEIRARGHAHHAEVRVLEAIDAPPAIVERLELSARQRRVFHSVIVHFEGSLPIQLEDRWVNPRIAPAYLKIDFSRVTPHEHLIEVAPLERIEYRVSAVAPVPSVKEALSLGPNEPALLIERVTWSRGIAASFARLHHPGSRYELCGSFNP